MADLNLSTNGSSIARSYQSIVDSPVPSGPASASPTYGQWAVFSVTAPLVSAFQQGGGKESVLKVESTGEGELQDLIDEFSDGRIQFAFLKIKDPNSGLRKSALIGWCGEGVPERTKGYFSSHQAAVAKLLHGYHVQLTARSDSDLTPDGILRKVSDASGAKYSSSEMASSSSAAVPPAKKTVFTPLSSNSASGSFNPLAGRRAGTSTSQHATDEDGWGDDAPPVTRTQLEKVESAYKPTRVDIGQLRAGIESTPPKPVNDRTIAANADVIKGGYQPVGKVDIAAIRRQAAESGQLKDERPSPVKGAYEPIGKVNIADIKARSQPSNHSSDTPSSNVNNSFVDTPVTSKALPDRSAAFQGQGRLSEMPKPKIASRFGSGAPSFGATKAPAPGEFGLQSGAPISSGAPTGAGRTFAASAGKSPAQLWAEKKAAQGSQQEETSITSSTPTAQPIPSQSSGGWKSGYEGKKWATVQTSKAAASASSNDHDADDTITEDDTGKRSQDLSTVRGYLAEDQGSQPPSLNVANKPNFSGPVAMPGMPTSLKVEEEEEDTPRSPAPVLPSPPARTKSPSSDEQSKAESPVRIAVPVARGSQMQLQGLGEESRVPPTPEHEPSFTLEAKTHDDDDELNKTDHDNADTAEATASGSIGAKVTQVLEIGAKSTGKSAIAQYDYEKAEDNELELKEGETIVNIEMVDPDWWMGQNSVGETGLFPSNFVELVEQDSVVVKSAAGAAEQAPPPPPPATASAHTLHGTIAIAQYDYEAAEDNELSFPEGAKITNVEFPDEDWWSGEYNGAQGLFPSNYVELEQ